MELNVTEKKEDKIKFKVSGIDHELANALRRIIISEVPTMAIEKVRIEKNSSTLNDEILSHRLGLVPLKTDLETYNFMSECDCDFEGCGKCTAVLRVEGEGPGTIYCKDFESSDPNVVPAYGEMPLVRLGEGQEVEIEATARLGRGKDHIKWQAGLASYEMEEDEFNFFIESYGQLSPKELTEKAFDVFQKRVSKLKEEIK